MDGGHIRKKPKTSIDDSTATVLLPLSYDSNKRQELSTIYTSACPFPHIAFGDLCDDAFLRQVRNEIIHELKADYKETDIFKVLQTQDLANLEKTNNKTASLLKLRDAIYSEEFRAVVQEITCCPPLTEQVDCSCNIYPQRGHLLCHDDVIGSRCVSYILYLSDPDTDWTASDGGTLELYGTEKRSGDLKSIPEKRLLPVWNQIVLFRVEPDVSFHSVEEVRTQENHRLSLSGWFHTSPEFISTKSSSLNQLKGSQCTLQSHFQFEKKKQAECLGAEDARFLEKWVNQTYLAQENIDRIYERFHEEGSIQLRDFLNEKNIREATALMREAESEMMTSKEQSDYGNGWRVEGPPNKQRFLEYKHTKAGSSVPNPFGVRMKEIEQDLFRSQSFSSLLHQMTGLEITGGSSSLRCLRPGSDYTIAVYNPHKTETLDAVLCFVRDDSEEFRCQWENGEVGGFEAYLLADSNEQEAADVYRASDDATGVLSVSPVCNTLNLVLSDDGLIKFVKYLGADAPGCRWDISSEYTLEKETETTEVEPDAKELKQ